MRLQAFSSRSLKNRTRPRGKDQANFDHRPADIREHSGRCAHCSERICRRGSLVKRLLVSISAWLAFVNAVMVLNTPVFIVVCSKCDMFENKSLYYRLTHGYYDLLATLPGEVGLWLCLGLSPAIWVLLYVWTGATRILPWKRLTPTGDDG